MRTAQQVTAFAYDKRGRLLSIGRNSYVKSHPLQARFAHASGQPHRIYLHAEIDALIRARRRVHRLEIFRINKQGVAGCSKPCRVCARAIKFFGVKEVRHT